MRRLCCYISIIFWALAGSTVWADQIVLQNGDRLTGKILESNQEHLIIESEFAGTVTVQWSAIEEISSDQPLHFTLQDSQMVVGSVRTRGGQLQVESEQVGGITLNKDAIEAIRSPERFETHQAEIERLRNPGLLDLWSGSADVGLSLSKGNSDTTSLAFGFNAARVTPRDRIGVYANSIYASNSTTGLTLTTANAVRGGARYDLNVSQRSFLFGLGDLESDEFQNLDLRVVLGGGYGWHAIKNDRTTFDVFGGGSYNREFFSTGLNRTSGEILLGEEMAHKLSERTSMSQRLVFYPNLSETGEYRLNFDLSAITRIAEWLNWHVSLSDRYLSNPDLGAQTNDVLLTTGVRLTFGR